MFFMITIIGSGKVGGDAALFSALKRLDDQVLLLDVVNGLPQGEAMDINHMLSEQGIDVEVKGSNDFADMQGSKIVVVVAGSGRKPGMTRMDLLKINAGVVKSVVDNIKKYANDSMIIPVTNPLDPMAYVTYKASGFEKNRVFGMGGMLDLSRFRQFIHEATGYSRDSIRALVIGEHGENMLPLPRFSSVMIRLRATSSSRALGPVPMETALTLCFSIRFLIFLRAASNSLSGLFDTSSCEAAIRPVRKAKRYKSSER